MTDFSDLDKKYFLDSTVYNCAYCNRRNVSYRLVQRSEFDWSNNKTCYVYFVKCASCFKVSMHLSFEPIHTQVGGYYSLLNDIDIDSKIFYSVPTSFFVLDSRVPKILRELITEAEGCLKMNFLTGSSACIRKSIYELLVIEKCSKQHYTDRIKELKTKYKDTDPTLFDILGHIQGMTSDKIHEQSWDQWNSANLNLIIETLKTVLYDIYVIPAIKAERTKAIIELKESIGGQKNKEDEVAKPDNT